MPWRIFLNGDAVMQRDDPRAPDTKRQPLVAERIGGVWWLYVVHLTDPGDINGDPQPLAGPFASEAAAEHEARLHADAAEDLVHTRKKAENLAAKRRSNKRQAPDLAARLRARRPRMDDSPIPKGARSCTD